MTSPFILWILMCIALVKGRSNDLSPDTLDTENYRNEVTVSDMEQSISKTDLENQDDVENSEVYSRRGIDGLRLSIGSSQLSDSESMNLGIALDDSLNAVSDGSNLMGRSSALGVNDSPDTNYENLANLRASIDPVASSSDVDNQDDLDILNMNRIHDPNDAADLSDLNRGGILTLVSRSGRNDLNPVNVGINVARLSTLNGLRSGGRDRVNRLGSNVLNEDGVISADAEDNVYILKSDSLNDVIRKKLNNLDIAQKIGRTGSFKINDASRNDLRVSNCNNLNSEGVSRTGTDYLEDAHYGHYSNNLGSMIGTNQGSRAEIANSKKSLVLEGVNRHDKSSNVDSISAHNNLELNNLDSKAIDRKADQELSNLMEHVKSGTWNGVIELDPNNIDLSKGEALSDNDLMQNLRSGLDRVSLNDLNKAKRLLGPLNLNRDLSDRSNSEIDKDLLNALNVEGDFNALGALVVLSKLVEKPNSLSALNEADDMLNSRNINPRKEINKNIDSKLLRNLEAPEVSEIDELTNSNPLPHILNNLYDLARSDSPNDVEKGINPQNSLRSSSENHNNLDQYEVLVKSKSENQLFGSEREHAIENSPSRASSLDDDRLNTQELDRRGLYIPYGATRPVRKLKPFKPYKTYRPSQPSNSARYLYRPRVRDGLNDDQNLNSNDNNLDGLYDNTPIISLRDTRNGNRLDNLLRATDNSMINDISAGLNEAQVKSLKAHRSHMNDRSHNLNEINHIDSEGIMRPLTNFKSVRDGSNLLLTSADSAPTQRRTPANVNLKLISREDINALNNLVPLPVMLSSDSNKVGALYGLVHLDEMN